MRRQEMIELMADEIRGKIWDVAVTRIELEYAYYIAENILDLVEELGMLPPPADFKYTHTDGEIWTSVIRKWEPKDDE